MSDVIGILIGIIGLAIGLWAIYSATRPELHPWLRTWWLPKDYAGRENIERLVALVAGAGFLVIGFLTFIASLWRLFS